jgi:hypothetical protein
MSKLGVGGVLVGASAAVQLGLWVDRSWESGAHKPSTGTWADRCRLISSEILKQCERDMKVCPDRQTYVLILLKKIAGAIIAFIGALLQAVGHLFVKRSPEEIKIDQAILKLSELASDREAGALELSDLKKKYELIGDYVKVLKEALMKRGVETGLPMTEIVALIKTLEEAEKNPDNFKALCGAAAHVHESQKKLARLTAQQAQLMQRASQVQRAEADLNKRHQAILDETARLQKILQGGSDGSSR